MTPLQIDYKYMGAFYGKEPLEDMHELLVDNLDFEGPFYRFKSGGDYFRSLQANPPAESSYEVLNACENRHSACLICRFTKPGIDTLMAQVFEVKSDKITKVRLIFDTSKFV